MSNPGSWSATYQTPVVPVAAVMLPTGSILMWSSVWADSHGGDIGTDPSSTWISFFDPTTGVVSPMMDAGVQADMFCPGISYLPNGDILIAGGSSSSHTTLFDPFTGQWSDSGDLNIARGYNSAVTLSNGDVFTIGGSWSGNIGPKDGELWSPTIGWLPTGIPGYSILATDDLIDQAQGYISEGDDHNWLFAMPNGGVFDAGPSAQMNFADPLNGTITPAGTRGDDQYSINGNAVMYAPGKILKVGGAQLYSGGFDPLPGSYPASNSAYLIDISQDYASPTAMTMPIVTKLSPMNFARAYSNAVVLPDGEVFIVGGQTSPHEFHDDNAVMTPEMWNPVTMQFTELAPLPTPRDYHSSALLMPDGRIWVGGGGACGACADNVGNATPDPSANHTNFEIYTPPYLYTPDGSLAVRPMISSAPASLYLGNHLTVNTSGGNVTSFSLVRLGTSTHSVDSDQRRVPLTIESAANGTFTLDVPSDPGTTVPGYWMLFAMDANGIPSVSKIIQIESGSGGTPTPTPTPTPTATTSVIGSNAADTVNLTGDSRQVVIDLAGNDANVSAGLNSPSLTFVGSPDAVILGSGPSTVQYALQAGSGIETISNFQLGLDQLNIDLFGAANSTLMAFDTTVNGAKAIALASSADLAHGVVLLNTDSETASNLLTSDTTFSSGHALIA